MGARGGFDAQGRLTIGGQPRFAFGVYASGGGFAPDPAYFEQQVFGDDGWGLHDIPINVILPYTLGAMSWAATDVLLDVLQRHGIAFLLTCNCFEGGSWRRLPFAAADESYVRRFAQHPAALGYYLADEPWDTMLAETVWHRAQLRAWDPDGVTFAALMAGYPSGQATRTDPATWTEAADVLGVDPYPLYGAEPSAGYTHFIVADYVSKLRTAAQPDRPVWAVLQCFRGSSESRLPTFDEMRAHAIMAIVEGAQGILWWEVGANGLQHEDPATVAQYRGYLRELVTELAGLEPALLAENVNRWLVNSTAFADPVTGRIAQLRHNISVEWLYSRIQWYQAEISALQAGDRSWSGGMLEYAANVRTRAMVANGHGYVFAYNYTNQSQPVTFTVPGVEPYHISVRESRRGNLYPVFNDGTSWNDTFGPYESRIYIIDGSAARSFESIAREFLARYDSRELTP